MGNGLMLSSQFQGFERNENVDSSNRRQICRLIIGELSAKYLESGHGPFVTDKFLGAKFDGPNLHELPASRGTIVLRIDGIVWKPAKFTFHVLSTVIRHMVGKYVESTLSRFLTMQSCLSFEAISSQEKNLKLRQNVEEALCIFNASRT